MKLGELLVKAGKITSAQLEETLKGQVIFGGRLGTNLVEMGFLSEAELTQFLSRKAGVPPASSDQLMEISPLVKKLVPEETVRKKRVVPVGVQNRKLYLAMVDPSDFATIEEISFLTGYIVTPLVAPELRVVTALEKHYNVKRDMRYIRVGGKGRGEWREEQKAKVTVPQVKPAPAPRPLAEPEEEIIELPLLCEVEYLSGDDDSLLMPVTAAAPAAALAPVAAAPPVAAPAPLTLEEVLTGLADARDRHDIAELVVGHAAQLFEHGALFLVKGGQASGWLAQRRQEPVQGFELLEMSLQEPSVIKTVADTRAFHLGPLPITPCNGRILAALGSGPRQHALLIPLLLMGRVVAILYVGGDVAQLGEQLPYLQKLMAKASLAFEILLLRGKILAP